MDQIDAILYINLAHRTDRKQHILAELSKICTDSSKIHRIDAVYKNPGALGCLMSHIQSLLYALTHKDWQTVLVVEDDFTFNCDTPVEQIKSLFSQPFEVGLLSHNYLQCTDTDQINVKRVTYSQTSSSYIIRRSYIPVLLQNFNESLADMLSNGQMHTNCLDIHWKTIQLKHQWYALMPAIGYQYANFSDITQTFVDYGDSLTTITVIVPSIGRPEITRTLRSLLSLTNPNWKALIGFDAVKDIPDLLTDPRISYLFLPQKAGGGKNYGGGVRNRLIKAADTKWICFVDDDDTLRPHYIDSFLSETIATPSAVAIMFRMSYNRDDSHVLPPIGISQPVKNQVGISFAVQRQFLLDNKIEFVNGPTEDYDLLRRIHEAKGKIAFSRIIAYNIRF